MYYYAADFLREKGYSHYEISNYSRPGYECRHNLKYWRCREYIGVGLAAYSYFGGQRYGNTDNPLVYLNHSDNKLEYSETVSTSDAAYEYVMLGLRLSDGFSLTEYKELFGKDFLDGRREIIDFLANEGYLNLSNNRISLTERGYYVSNEILTDLI